MCIKYMIFICFELCSSKKHNLIYLMIISGKVFFIYFFSCKRIRSSFAVSFSFSPFVFFVGLLMS